MNTVNLTPLLNREFKLPDDGVFQFAPIGEYPIVDPVTRNRIVQVVDAESVRLMAADIAAQAAKPNWPGLLVDRDHFSYDTEKETRAAGWANSATARAEGLFGPIRFTSSGKAEVEGGDYRFLSPVFDRKSAVPLGGDRFRVVKLLGLALTNKPNLRNIQALTNRAEEFHGREATTTATKPTMNKVIALLGLAATATEDDVVSSVQALKNRVGELEPFKGQHATLQSEHTALKNRYDSLLGDAVTKALDEYKGVITEESKEAWKNRLTADFGGTVALLKGIKPAAAAADKGKKKPLHSTGRAAAAAAGAEEEGDENPFMNRVADEQKANPKLSRGDAIVLVAQREPALYEAYRGSLHGGDE